MACFLVPTAEALIVSGVALVVKKIEQKHTVNHTELVFEGSNNNSDKDLVSKKLFSLSKLLYGGSFLLAFEHAWHGEIIPVYPFLSATSNAASTTEMIREMSTVGVTMSLVVTSAWAVFTIGKVFLSKKAKTTKKVCM